MRIFALSARPNLSDIIPAMFRKNPCESCGACCAYFRVSFYWGESDGEKNGTVPAELIEDVSPFLQAMKGTNQQHPHCIALEGEVGHLVRCKIYEYRPSTCQDFGVHWQDGVAHIDHEDLVRCNQARADFGLPELTNLVPRFQIKRPDLKHEKKWHSSIHLNRKSLKGNHSASGNRIY